MNIPSINKFLIDEIINNTSKLSKEFKTKADLQNKIKNYGLEEVSSEELIKLKQLSQELLEKKNNIIYYIQQFQDVKKEKMFILFQKVQ